MTKSKKFLSFILVLVFSLSIAIPAFAAAPETIAIDFEDGFTVKTNYPASDYNVARRTVGSQYIADIIDSSGNVVETFSMKIPNAPVTRGVGNILRTFTNTKYEYTGSIKICGITNEVVLKIYVNGSFKQIESVESNRVYMADGVTLFSLSDTTAVASPPNNFPAQYVDCVYSGTCSVQVNVGTGLTISGNIGSAALIGLGFSVGPTVGTTVYYNKTLRSAWSISL